MTTYVQSNRVQETELRVISALLQQQAPNSQQDELKVLRNDVLFDANYTTPVSSS
jgi:hypothetical protein